MAFDFLEMATKRSRDSFVSSCPFYFLVGQVGVVDPGEPRRSVTLDPFGADNAQTVTNGKPPEPSGLQRVAVAIRKIQDTFPHMITVGRTRNNDVVIPDLQVSKFHAWFEQERGGALKLVDSGSANGTRVGDRQLAPRGSPHAVHPGDTLYFGQLPFLLLDAGGCWDHLHST
jgi:hypothetical protein